MRYLPYLIAILFIVCLHILFINNYKFSEVTFVSNKDSVITKSFLVPIYAEFHIYKGKLQYTKENGWHETVQYNVKKLKSVK